MLFWHSPRLFSPARRSSKFIKAKNMPNLEKWSGLFSILVTEILNLRDCSQLLFASRCSTLALRDEAVLEMQDSLSGILHLHGGTCRVEGVFEAISY